MITHETPHLLFAKTPSPRLGYIVQTLLGKHWQITHNIHFFEHTDAIKINYSGESIQCICLKITPHGLVYESGIKEQRIVIDAINHLPVFFCTEDKVGFDILAASFYLLSRYEEYLPHEPDSLGRFPANKSLAYHQNFLHLPLIHLWLQQFEKQMQSLFPAYQLPQQNFVFIPGFDIDRAFKYHYQGIIKNIAVFFKAMLTGNFEAFKEAANVFTGKQRDPFDVFEALTQLFTTQQRNALFFFLVAQKKQAPDKNTAPYKKGMKQLIETISQQFDVGIHLSVQSSTDRHLNVAEQELKTLSFLTKTSITTNRFHYLCFQLPHSYEQLVALGITADYSMGYSTVNGFRASYAQPFQWYHLQKETTTNLTVYPFCWMDTACIFQQKLTPGAAYAELMQFIQITQSVKGTCLPVWHNHCISHELDRQPWKTAFHDFISNL
ncbi:hypothetical protein [Hydrotalea sp.]|uniref:DUF7033 domain-containing protein n=1 Tax=Hydrotalea sp. TaxID=2881279 RepID=UPI0026028A0F|nr:hypothetical protein [Hydrotalea sp.]